VRRSRSKYARQPRRFSYPYGKWTAANGREVLFNRYYEPIYEKYPHEDTATTVKAWAIIPWTKQIFFFNDGNPPWADKKTKELCCNILKSWNVGLAKNCDDYDRTQMRPVFQWDVKALQENK
jgi:hypothetical protein